MSNTVSFKVVSEDSLARRFSLTYTTVAELFDALKEKLTSLSVTSTAWIDEDDDAVELKDVDDLQEALKTLFWPHYSSFQRRRAAESRRSSRRPSTSEFFVFIFLLLFILVIIIRIGEG
ncbi:unnamed protein product [Caenorhabditis auriculariae]|uniref:PB1 domain-containing protein n=1 Tax=Caenorhabditis auriculariae TaxID=2777116 RepID=A0A8S1HGX8_9PELO|nr:unnamed protein product [Caenorhabditis auriculariae]